MADPLAIISMLTEVMLMEAGERSVPAAVVDDLTMLDPNVKRLCVTLGSLPRPPQHADGLSQYGGDSLRRDLSHAHAGLSTPRRGPGDVALS